MRFFGFKIPKNSRKKLPKTAKGDKMAYVFDELKNKDDLESSAVGVFAPIDSPELTGIPTVPTAPNSTNSNTIANIEFVQAMYDIFYPIGTVILVRQGNSFNPMYGSWSNVGEYHFDNTAVIHYVYRRDT